MASHRSDIPPENTHDASQHLTVGGTTYETRLTKKFLRRKPWVAPDPKEISCLIPGVMLKINVRQGHKVRKGDSLFVLEAMKMQNDFLSPIEGTVSSVHVQVGQQVSKGELLMELE
jgi:biotin carboxyl carrier protein